MARGHITHWMLWYWYRKSGWLCIRCSHPNIHGTRVLILLLGAVGVTKIFITIMVIVLEKCQNRYVHQIKVAQGQTPTRPQTQVIGSVALPY